MTCNINGDVTYATKCREDKYDLEKAVMVALLKQFGINFGLVDGIIKRSQYLEEGQTIYCIGLNTLGGYCVKECIWKWEYLEELFPLFYGNVYKTREEAEKKNKKYKRIEA